MTGKPRDRRVQAAPMDAAPELFGVERDSGTGAED
jgi:hypothetical protein